MAPLIGPGRAELSITAVPIFENSGQCAASSVSNESSESSQAILPLAALAAREKPSGRVIATERISEGDGAVGLWAWGTFSVTSSPETLSAAVVVGVTARLGSKVSSSQPVVGGHALSAVATVPV